jgi:hypothetical protein
MMMSSTTVLGVEAPKILLATKEAETIVVVEGQQ